MAVSGGAAPVSTAGSTHHHSIEMPAFSASPDRSAVSVTSADHQSLGLKANHRSSASSSAAGPSHKVEEKSEADVPRYVRTIVVAWPPPHAPQYVDADWRPSDPQWSPPQPHQRCCTRKLLCHAVVWTVTCVGAGAGAMYAFTRQ